MAGCEDMSWSRFSAYGGRRCRQLCCSLGGFLDTSLEFWGGGAIVEGKGGVNEASGEQLRRTARSAEYAG